MARDGDAVWIDEVPDADPLHGEGDVTGGGGVQRIVIPRADPKGEAEGGDAAVGQLPAYGDDYRMIGRAAKEREILEAALSKLNYAKKKK